MPRIDQLTAVTAITGDDLLPVIDAPASTNVLRKITAANARNYFSPATNVRIAGNLVGDGATNDAVGLQAVIDASSNGDTLFFDRIFGVSATIKLKPGRKYLGSSKDMSGIKQLNGSNLDWVMADENWYNNGTVMSPQYVMEDFQIDINKAGQSSGAGIGLVCANAVAVHRSCLFINYNQAGVKLSTANRADTTMSSVLSEPRFWECQFRGNGTGQGIWQYDPSLSKCADGWVVGCAFAGGERGVYLPGGAAGWVIMGNHFYAQRKDAIYGVGATATTVTGNYIEGWGYDPTTVVEKWAIGLEFANGPWPSTITGNAVVSMDPSGNGTQLGYVRGIQYYGVTGAAVKVAISGNALYARGASDGASSVGIWVGSQGGGGTVICSSLSTNQVYGWTTPLVTDAFPTVTYQSFPNGGNYYVGTFASTYTPSVFDGNTQQITLTGNITIAAPTNAYTAGARLTFVFIQDSNGTRTVSFNSVFKKAGGAFTASTGNAAKCSIGFVFDGTNWYEVSRALALA